jgi:hypothetical protein
MQKVRPVGWVNEWTYNLYSTMDGWLLRNDLYGAAKRRSGDER